jgi:hypothetical protein
LCMDISTQYVTDKTLKQFLASTIYFSQATKELST